MIRMPPASALARTALAVSAVALGCGSPIGDATTLTPPADAASPEAPVCDGASAAGSSNLGRSSSPLSVVDRSLIGAPGDYRPDPGLTARELDLVGSQRARREAAWQ